MSKGLQVGRLAGIPVSVEAGLVLLAGLFIVTLAGDGLTRLDPAASLTLRIAVASATVAVFLASVLAHELGHAFTARRRGVGVLGVTLSLFGGYAQLDRQAPDPRSEFTIAAAGPTVNLALAVLLGIAAWGADAADLVRLPFEAIGADRLIVGALIWLAAVNAVLAVLNLVPASPLDGGRVLTAALWRRLGDGERARVLSGRAGLVLGLVLIPAGLAQTWWWGWRGLVTTLVGIFLFNGARGEIATATIRGRLARTSAEQLMVTDPPAVHDSLTLDQLSTLVGNGGARVAFPVVRWGSEPIGYVVPADASSLGPPERSWTRVSALMRPTPAVARAWMNEAIATILHRQAETADLVVVIHEPQAGRVVGTLSEGQIDVLFQAPDLWGRDRLR